MTLNDPVYEEAAEALARRVMKDTAEKPPALPAPTLFWMPGLPMKHAWSCLAIRPPRELAVLRTFYQEALAMHDRPAW